MAARNTGSGWPFGHTSKHQEAARLGWERRRAAGNTARPAKGEGKRPPREAITARSYADRERVYRVANTSAGAVVVDPSTRPARTRRAPAQRSGPSAEQRLAQLQAEERALTSEYMRLYSADFYNARLPELHAHIIRLRKRIRDTQAGIRRRERRKAG